MAMLRRLKQRHAIWTCAALSVVAAAVVVHRSASGVSQSNGLQVALRAVMASNVEAPCTDDTTLVGSKALEAMRADGSFSEDKLLLAQENVGVLGNGLMTLLMGMPKVNRLVEYPQTRDHNGFLLGAAPALNVPMQALDETDGTWQPLPPQPGDPGLARADNGSLVLFLNMECRVSNDEGITWGPATKLQFDKGDVPDATAPVFYPQAVKILGKYHLVSFPSMFVWEAADFPTKWVARGGAVAPGVQAVHSTLTVIEDGTKAIVLAGTMDGLLGFTTDLTNAAYLGSAGWTPHPRNALETALDRSMPAGNLFSMPFSSELIRPAQDITIMYGRCIKAYRVTKLTAEDFAEEYIGVIAGATGRGRDAFSSHVMGVVRGVHEDRLLAYIDGAEDPGGDLVVNPLVMGYLPEPTQKLLKDVFEI